MTDNKTGFFEEAPGLKSMTRLITFLGSVGVLSMAGYMIHLKSGGPLEIASFLGIGLAAVGATKVAGAMMENKKEEIKVAEIKAEAELTK